MTDEQLATVFDRLAEHERQLASCFRITGRYAIAQHHEARREAYAEAAGIARGEHGDPAKWLEAIGA